MYDTMASGFQHFHQLNTLYEQCHCVPACDKLEFQRSVTLASFANTNLNHSSYINNWPSHDVPYMQRNFVHMRIYYDSLDYTITEQKPKLSYQSVLSDIGGLLGIFLGASFMTMIEIIEYMCHRSFGFCKSFFFNKNKNIVRSFKTHS